MTGRLIFTGPLLAALGVIGCQQSKADSHSEGVVAPTCQRVSGEQAKALVERGATLLDVRTPEEYREGHLEDAQLVPHEEVAGRLDEIPKDEPVVIYCATGRRAGIAADTLRERGYTAYNMGGIDDWNTEGNPCME